MRIAVPRERRPAERRVATTPEMAKKLIALGYEIAVETGAGAGAGFADDAYQQAGASIVPSPAALYSNAQLVLKVQRPLSHTERGDGVEELSLLQPGCILIGMLNPLENRDAVRSMAERRIDAYALDRLPRISRAQTMDVLSSQSSLAGYKAVLEAANLVSRALPLMMTAAGTIPPAKVLVIGIGVAGLQAIATAKRLGAVVSATDVRPETREQVASLGGTFVESSHVAEAIARQDIVITTALVQGLPAPRLVSRAMVESMQPGSVIVDLAVEQGGNCELSRPGEVVEAGGVMIVGHLNMPSRLASDATALYARNLYNFIAAYTDNGVFAPLADDPIIAATAITRGGQVLQELA